MASIKKNFSYNLILTFCGYIFPLLTLPYVSRVLGVERIGICNFVDGIINYIVILAALGIGSLGVREIAKVKTDKKRLAEVFSTLLFVNMVFSLVMILALVVATNCISQLFAYEEFLLIGICKIASSALLIEWFFQGLSDFKYITIRSFIIKCLYTILVFILVRNEEDTECYYGLTCGIVAINAIVNCKYSTRFVQFSFSSINCKAYLLPILSFGVYRILTSLYTGLNVVYLGFVAGDTQVGLFTTATKLHTIFISVLSALTAVVIPRVSELISRNDTSNLKRIATQSIDIVLAYSIPIAALCFVYATELIDLLAGSGYEGAIIPFQIISVLLVIIGLEQIIVQQFLMASNNNRFIILISCVGSAIGIALNLILTPRLNCIGSSISWAISELAILLISARLFKKIFAIEAPYSRTIKYALITIPIFLIANIHFSSSPSKNIIISVICNTIWVLVAYTWVIKNPIKDILLQIITKKRA